MSGTLAVTPATIINLALKDVGEIGEGQTASADDMQDAFTRLNWMLAQWQRKRWMVWHLIDLSVVSTGAKTYTIGPAAGSPNIITPGARPDSLQYAYVRQLNTGAGYAIDYPLSILQSMEDYAQIAMKSLTSFPGYIFLDTAYPQGTIYPWPVPQASIYEIHVLMKDALNQFVTIQDTINLPEEYLPALEYNLAIRLFPTYGLPVDPDIKALAKDAMNVIKVENTQIARLTMPEALVRPGVYNPYSDQVR